MFEFIGEIAMGFMKLVAVAIMLLVIGCLGAIVILLLAGPTVLLGFWLSGLF